MSTAPDRHAPSDSGEDRRDQTSFLGRVCAEAAERVAAAREHEPLEVLRARAAATVPPRPFGAALSGGVIAEVKRASPSRGLIAAGRDAVAQARSYEAGGAAAISVLTEPVHFHGSLDDLAAVSAAVRLPVLRKDFIVDGYQLFEARAAGAAAALLLVAALEQSNLVRLLRAAAEAGIEVLVETHDVDEITRALAAVDQVDGGRRPVIGVNARDLRRLSVERSRFAELAAALPTHAIVVAESGVTGPGDVAAYRRAGADAVLVGEHLMRADDAIAATRALVTAAHHPHDSVSDPE